MEYGVHPSKELKQIFSEKPYQGQDPEIAKVLILGNDANYSPEISDHKFFREIVKYHGDGVRFWKKTGKHHPFLLQSYPFHRSKGGVRYHQNFSKMGFTEEYAEYFSFVELLDVPTIGNTGSNKNLFYELLNRTHLEWLEHLILDGDKTFVMITQTLANSIRVIHKRFGVFSDLAKVLNKTVVATEVFKSPSVVLYNGYSFSYTITNQYLQDLARRIQRFIATNDFDN